MVLIAGLRPFVWSFCGFEFGMGNLSGHCRAVKLSFGVTVEFRWQHVDVVWQFRLVAFRRFSMLLIRFMSWILAADLRVAFQDLCDGFRTFRFRLRSVSC